MSEKKIKILMPCTGVGVINRGYETFTVECFNQFKKIPEFDVKLIKGGGKAKPDELVLPYLKKETPLAALIGKLRRRPPVWAQDNTFALAMIPTLLKEKPDVIYYFEVFLGNALWELRKILGLKYKLIFINGALLAPAFNKYDHIQQLLPYYYDISLSHGIPAQKMTTLPHAIEVKIGSLEKKDTEKQIAIKKQYNIPLNRKVLISVGAINSSHKRMDYVIKEVSNIDKKERPFLIIIGQKDSETQTIVDLADKLLEKDYLSLTLSKEKVLDFYYIADLFTLASVQEGLPMVFLEALSFGLPILVHDYPISRQTLADKAYYSDFTKENGLNYLIKSLLSNSSRHNPQKVLEYVQDNYSWNRLLPEYVKIIKTALQN